MTTATAEKNICARISRRVASVVGTQRYRMWFDRSAKLDYRESDQRLDVTVPNRFVADWISKHFLDDLRRAVSEEIGKPISLNLLVRCDQFAHQSSPPGDNRPSLPQGRHDDTPPSGPKPQTAGRGAPCNAPRDRRLLPHMPLRHRLEDFVTGSSNELAFTAACRVIEDDHTAVSPLFLHGGCGVGKTHLLQGVCSKMLEAKPQARVLYITAEQFTNDFLTAMRTNKLQPFRKRIRRLDLLAIDDVHFLANKQATQQEFLHSFDAIELGGARLVLASDSHPKLIKRFSEALISRCMRGMVVMVGQPDFDTRVKIIEALVRRRGVEWHEAAIQELARRCVGSVREIEGTLTKVYATAALTRTRRPMDTNELCHGMVSEQVSGTEAISPIGCALIHRVFEAEESCQPRRAVSFETILNTVVTHLGVSRAQVLGPSRHRHVVLARSLVIYTTRQWTSMSYPEIAAAMGRRTHSTIVTAAQRVEQWLKNKKQTHWTLPVSGEQVPLTDLIGRIKHTVLRAGYDG